MMVSISLQWCNWIIQVCTLSIVILAGLSCLNLYVCQCVFWVYWVSFEHVLKCRVCLDMLLLRLSFGGCLGLKVLKADHMSTHTLFPMARKWPDHARICVNTNRPTLCIISTLSNSFDKCSQWSKHGKNQINRCDIFHWKSWFSFVNSAMIRLSDHIYNTLEWLLNTAW